MLRRTPSVNPVSEHARSRLVNVQELLFPRSGPRPALTLFLIESIQAGLRVSSTGLPTRAHGCLGRHIFLRGRKIKNGAQFVRLRARKGRGAEVRLGDAASHATAGAAGGARGRGAGERRVLARAGRLELDGAGAGEPGRHDELQRGHGVVHANLDHGDLLRPRRQLDRQILGRALVRDDHGNASEFADDLDLHGFLLQIDCAIVVPLSKEEPQSPRTGIRPIIIA